EIRLEPVARQIRDSHHYEVVPLAEPGQVSHTCHRAIVIDDLADDTARMEPCKTGEIDRRLGVAPALEDAAGACTNRKDVPGYGEVLPPAAGLDCRPDRFRAAVGGKSRRDTAALHVD